MLKKGADTEFKDPSKYTIIQSATFSGYIKIVKLLIQYGANLDVKGPIDESKTLIEFAVGNKSLQSFLKLTIAYKDNNFGVIDESVTVKDIEFILWKVSLKPTYSNSNAKACFKYYQELDNFKKFLEVTREFNVEELNYALNSCVTLKDLAVSTITENPKSFKPNILSSDLEDKLSELGLVGETIVIQIN